MNKEIKKRKKRFWALCLVTVMMLLQTSLLNVFATEYTVINNSSTLDPLTEFVKENDVISYDYRYYDFANSINYYDKDGTTLLISDPISHNVDDKYQYTIKSYNGSQINDGMFRGWKIEEIKCSAGLQSMKLTAVAYTQSNINYVLNGGTNSSANPEKYYEKKEEIPLEAATKTGYSFDGWYTAADFNDNSKITSISTTQTGDVTLYAKFKIKDYAITYELKGGTNATGNPTSYTYGTGVESFAAATKTGYSFDGWYTAADFNDNSKITSISTTQTGEVRLYAKFKAKDYVITYELNGGTNATVNPTSYTYGIGVTSFADATKTGYTFDGWYTAADFNDNSKITSISTSQTEELKLYAKFTKNPGNDDAPPAGDNNMTLCRILLPFCICGMIGVVIYRRKKFNVE